jgi:AsmA protein
MKRIAAVLAVLLAAAAGYFLLMSAIISVDTARGLVERQLAGWTGRDIAFDGHAELELLPAPSLILHDLRLAGPPGGDGTDILTARTVRADIRILPLLIGRISLSALTLDDSHVRLVNGKQGQRNWRFDGGPAAVQLALSGDLPFDRLQLNRAKITYENVRSDHHETVEVPDLTIDWANIAQPASLEGSLVMRGESIAFRTRIGNPPAFFDRKSTAFSAELASEMLNVQLDGQLADYKAARFSGQLEASGPSLRRIIAFFGGPSTSGPGLGAIAISGLADLKPNELFIDRGSVALDDNSATGTLSVALPGKPATPKLTGTLAFATLDLTPYLSALSGTDTADWSAARIDTDWFDKLKADIRVSADQIVAGPYTLGATAASAFLKDQMLQIGLAQSEFYGGGISGTISISDLDGDAGQTASLQLRASAFSFGEIIRLAANLPEFGGTATMTVDLETRGASLGEQSNNLSGHIGVVSRDGGVPDFGLGTAWEALQSNSALDGVSRGGVSFYRQFKFNGTLRRAILSVDEIAITTKDYFSELAGSFDLRTRDVGLEGSLAAAQEGGPRGHVKIHGPVSGPTISMTP